MTLLCAAGSAQSRHNAKGLDLEGTVLSVTARRTDSKTDPIIDWQPSP